MDGITLCIGGTFREKEYCLNPYLWSLYPFDPSDYLEYSGSYAPHLVLIQDGNQDLAEVISTHPYNGESLLKISNQLEGLLCKRMISNKDECFKGLLSY